jgi:hypothetical protein
VYASSPTPAQTFCLPQKKITTLKILTYIMAATGVANSHILQPQMVATMEWILVLQNVYVCYGEWIIWNCEGEVHK